MRSMSTLPHHVSNRAGNNLRKVISQIIDLACDAIEFPIDIIERRRHVELDAPQLAGDEAELSFELREPRLGEIDATLQVFELFFHIESHRRTNRRVMAANQQAEGEA